MFPAVNSSQRTGGSQRQKTPVGKGRSLMHWIQLGKSGKDLRGGVPKGLQRVTTDELSRHCTRKDAWMAIRGWVYNVTDYMDYHPGGGSELMRGAGTDATGLFDTVHKWVNVDRMLEPCLIGRLIDGKPPASSNFLSVPQQRATSLNVPNKPKKLSTSTGAMLAPAALQTLSKLPPPYNPQNHISWVQTSTSVVIMHQLKEVNTGHFTCDLLEEGKYLNLEIFNSSRSNVSFGCTITLHTRVQPKIEKITHKNDGKIAIKLMKIVETPPVEWTGLGSIASLTTRSHKRTCKVETKEQLTHDTSLFTIKLPQTSRIVTPVGAHVYLQIDIDDMHISRPFTIALPSIMADAAAAAAAAEEENAGTVLHFIIKSYDDGVLTSRFCQQEPGSDVVMFTRGEGACELALSDAIKNGAVMLCAGTGFTPMVRLVRALNYAQQTSDVQMFFFNKRERDIVWRDELAAFAEANANFRVEHFLSEADADWTGGRGRVTSDLISTAVGSRDDGSGEQKMVFVCGPTPFTTLVLKFLREMNFEDRFVHAFT